MQRGVEIELDAGVVVEHLEANGVLPADEFLFGVDADVQMVVEQIVVSAIWTVSSAQNVGTRRRGWSLRSLRLRCLLSICSGSWGNSLGVERIDEEDRNNQNERRSLDRAPSRHGVPRNCSFILQFERVCKRGWSERMLPVGDPSR